MQNQTQGTNLNVIETGKQLYNIYSKYSDLHT